MSDPLNLVEPSAPKKANRQAKVKSTEGQPFNIGKYSHIVKADPDSLTLSDEDVKPALRNVKSKGKGKKKMDGSLAASDFALSEEEKDFTMDSDEEASQMKKAVRASKSSVTISKAPTKGKGRGKVEKAPPQALGGRQRKGNGRALKAAVARAAEGEWSWSAL